MNFVMEEEILVKLKTSVMKIVLLLLTPFILKTCSGHLAVPPYLSGALERINLERECSLYCQESMKEYSGTTFFELNDNLDCKCSTNYLTPEGYSIPYQITPLSTAFWSMLSATSHLQSDHLSMEPHYPQTYVNYETIVPEQDEAYKFQNTFNGQQDIDYSKKYPEANKPRGSEFLSRDGGYHSEEFIPQPDYPIPIVQAKPETQHEDDSNISDQDYLEQNSIDEQTESPNFEHPVKLSISNEENSMFPNDKNYEELISLDDKGTTPPGNPASDEFFNKFYTSLYNFDDSLSTSKSHLPVVSDDQALINNGTPDNDNLRNDNHSQPLDAQISDNILQQKPPENIHEQHHLLSNDNKFGFHEPVLKVNVLRSGQEIIESTTNATFQLNKNIEVKSNTSDILRIVNNSSSTNKLDNDKEKKLLVENGPGHNTPAVEPVLQMSQNINVDNQLTDEKIVNNPIVVSPYILSKDNDYDTVKIETVNNDSTGIKKTLKDQDSKSLEENKFRNSRSLDRNDIFIVNQRHIEKQLSGYDERKSPFKLEIAQKLFFKLGDVYLPMYSYPKGSQKISLILDGNKFCDNNYTKKFVEDTSDDFLKLADYICTKSRNVL